MIRVRLQYNDVPGSDEEMELGLGSDASLASSCGERSCPLGVQPYLLGCSRGTGLANWEPQRLACVVYLVSKGHRSLQRAGCGALGGKQFTGKHDRRVRAGGSEVSDAMSEGERPDEASSLHPESEDHGMLAQKTDVQSALLSITHWHTQRAFLSGNAYSMPES